VFGADADSLIGTWKLVSWRVIVENEPPQNIFGPHPKGFLCAVQPIRNEEWNGTEQRRHFRIEGDKLFIESAPAPSIVFPGKTDFRRIVWEQEK